MDKNTNIEIGERIRQTRTSLGLSREKLSEMLGISSLFLGFIECGQRGMSLTTLINLCTVLNTSTDFILLGKMPSEPRQELIDAVNSIDEKFIPLAIENINSFKRLVSLVQKIGADKNSNNIKA